MSDTEAPLPPSKVLIVDDNAQNLELLEAYMDELEGVTTLCAVDGEKALDLVVRESPDLILLDIMMPRMSGYEVCKRLKSDPGTKDIPIIMVTALVEMGDIERAVDVGAEDYVTKPVNRVDLLMRVRSLLRLRHLAVSDDRRDSIGDDPDVGRSEDSES